uniref:Reverse transcriptase Ty1/copia-type domain-containing protein n=1 Tax=Chenopodium quinoa TaxID=63459 RepID=A0A803KSH2_CHEQI
MKKPDSFTDVAYVDDLLITGSDSKIISSLKEDMHFAFTIKDLGSLKYFLGIEVSISSSRILLNQRKYILDLLRDQKMENCKVAAFPLPKGLKLRAYDGDLLPDPEIYRRVVGKLLYLNLSRPDISFVLQQLSQFLFSPRDPHFSAAIHVLKYLKGTINLGLFYPANLDFSLAAYSDADWGMCADTGRNKHQKLDVHYVREKVQSGLVALKYVRSALQLADIMTKPLGSDQHCFLSTKIGLAQYSSTQEWTSSQQHGSDSHS